MARRGKSKLTLLRTTQAQRQARLAEAMGKLFLQDRVAKMEEEANTLEFKRHASNRQADKSRSNSQRTPAKTPARTRAPAPTQLAVRIIDASLLIYALRTLHEWIKEERYMLVIPLEALNVLDVLKKGDAPINIAARKATRFLDERITSHNPSPKGEPGMVAQGEKESVSWSDIVSYAEMPRVETNKEQRADPSSSDEAAKEAGARAADALLAGLDVPTAEAPPRRSSDSNRSGGQHTQAQVALHIRGTLGCMAWHESRILGKQYQGTAREDKTSDDRDILALAVAFPPEDAIVEGTQEARRFISRADGRVMKQWAESVDMNVVVAPTASSWLQLGGSTAESSQPAKSSTGKGRAAEGPRKPTQRQQPRDQQERGQQQRAQPPRDDARPRIIFS